MPLNGKPESTVGERRGVVPWIDTIAMKLSDRCSPWCPRVRVHAAALGEHPDGLTYKQ